MHETHSRKVYQTLKEKPSKARRRLAIAGSVAGSMLISPVLATMAVGVGVPLLLLYVYGVVPLSLCRNGSCGVSASSSGVRLDVDDDLMMMSGDAVHAEKDRLLKDVDKLHDGSTVTGMSIHSGSSMGVYNHHKLLIQAEGIY